jgi:hypothetical protein
LTSWQKRQQKTFWDTEKNARWVAKDALREFANLKPFKKNEYVEAAKAVCFTWNNFE